MKNKKPLLIILVIIILVIGILVVTTKNNEMIDKSSKNTTSSIDISINTDDDDEKIDWSTYQEKTYTLSKSITLTESGVYILTGTIQNGLIKINTTSNIKIVLNNVTITNQNGPAIYIEEAQDVIIETAPKSNNYLEDGTTYTGYEADVIGTIFSHDDITFQGSGTLQIKSNNEDAIVGKDDLKIVSGTYIIDSNDDGIRGKDSVYIQDGSFTITSQGDGIKSTNDTNTEKGYVLIENGTFNITSTLDGIDAHTKLSIKNGTFTINTGGGSSNVSTGDNWGRWGPYAHQTTQNNSAKGIKSKDNLVIENGTFSFDTSDDAVHCNSYIGIKLATINITSGDDAIHADKELIIDYGTINIVKSYEGLEAAKITINGGTIDIKSSDDGINIAGGNDSSAENRPGSNNYSSNEEKILTVNNGTIYIDATGDGIDVNGSAYINGGTIKVDGPTNNGNGALDYDRYFNVNGGTFIAAGASGMMQSISSSSTQYNIAIVFNSTYSSDDTITIIDDSGNKVISYNSNKSYNSLVASSSKFQKGDKYTIKVNDIEYETFTISNLTTSIGNYHGGQPGQPNQPGQPGRPNGRR